MLAPRVLNLEPSTPMIMSETWVRMEQEKQN